jgi:hypothetical protein
VSRQWREPALTERERAALVPVWCPYCERDPSCSACDGVGTCLVDPEAGVTAVEPGQVVTSILGSLFVACQSWTAPHTPAGVGR